MRNLEILCEDLEIPLPLSVGKEGGQLFPLNKDISIEMKNLEPGVLLSSPIAPCPQVNRETLLIHLMKGNLFGQGTFGATIGLKKKENLLTLSRAMPYDMDERTFKEAVEDFANIVDFWRDEVATHVEKAENEIL